MSRECPICGQACAFRKPLCLDCYWHRLDTLKKLRKPNELRFFSADDFVEDRLWRSFHFNMPVFMLPEYPQIDWTKISYLDSQRPDLDLQID